MGETTPTTTDRQPGDAPLAAARGAGSPLPAHRRRRSGALPAALVAGLLIGGAVGYWLHQPGVRVRTEVVERTVEVTPESCAEALALLSDSVEEAGDAAALVEEALDAIQRLDLGRLQGIGREAVALAERIRGEAADAGLAALDCRSKIRSG